MPPPVPWSARAAISSGRFRAWPQSTEANVKAASAKRKVRLVPKRSPIQPDVGMNIATARTYAITVHCTEATEAWKSRDNVGNATFTIV